jgi:anhydro-N-acetylmuramic acid kinase
MAEPARNLAAQRADARRWWIGASVASDVSHLAIVLAATQGEGLEAEVEIVDGMRAEIPDEIASRFARWNDPNVVLPRDAVDALATLRAELADLEAAVINAFLAQASVPAGRILAVGVLDPGMWIVHRGERDARSGYFGLCHAARLAERTGLNVIDAFPERDLACGGLGGPVTALAQAVLLGPSSQARLLVDLGRTTRLTYLRGAEKGAAGPRVLAFEAGPGMELIDHLVRQLTNGEHAFDPGGRFAVQGSQVEALAAHWFEDPFFRQPLPRWHPRGVRPERFVVDAMQKAVDNGWSVRDLVCTATHFVADVARQAATRRLPEGMEFKEIVVTGRGQHNGMLLRELTQRFAPIPVNRLGDLGIEIEAFEPAAAAVLAMFFVDQTPGNLPEVTGVDMARVLGHLTPGSPQNWQRLLRAMGASRSAVRPLRSAL